MVIEKARECSRKDSALFSKRFSIFFVNLYRYRLKLIFLPHLNIFLPFFKYSFRLIIFLPLLIIFLPFFIFSSFYTVLYQLPCSNSLHHSIQNRILRINLAKKWGPKVCRPRI